METPDRHIPTGHRPRDLFEPRPRHAYSPHAVELFRSAVDAAIGYAHEPLAPGSAGATVDLVRSHLSQYFDDRFYVRRPDDEDTIVSTAADGRVLAVTGARGAGKTTLLRRICLRPDLVAGADRPNVRTLAPGASESLRDPSVTTRQYVYLDMLTFLSVATVRNDAAPEEILGYILRELIMRTVFGDPSMEEEWALFRMKESKAFFAFQDQARLAINVASRKEWLNLPRNAAFSEAWRSAEERFTSRDYVADSFAEFLQFLAVTYRHRIVLVIDSLDHLLTATQMNVALALSKLVRSAGTGSAAVMAIREESFPALERSMEPLGGIAHLSIEPSPLRPTSVRLIRDFLRSRLTAVRDLREQIVGSQAGPTSEEFQQLLRINFRLLDVFVEQALSGERDSPVLHYLRHFCNGSLRQVGRVLQRMMYDAITDAHPLSPYSEIVETVRSEPEPGASERVTWEKRNRTLIRVHLYRKFFFYSRQGDRVPAAYPLIRLRPHARKARVLFPKLRLLDLLVECGSETVTLDWVRQVYAQFGVRDNVVDRAVQEVATPREPGDTGLVWTSRRVELGDPVDVARHTTIAIQDAGRYLRNDFCRTADYLFWAAASNQTTLPLFRQAASDISLAWSGNQIPFETLLKFEFRLYVAALYLTHRILPRMTVELPYRHKGDDGWKSAQNHVQLMFEAFGSDIYVQRAAWILEGFANNLVQEGRVPGDVPAQVSAIVDPCLTHARRVERSFR